uniref:Uncharacterized protein n=1 Tax=Plectus sambesii TaxID=2011161 RepID=A0A914WUN8_9BILA
MWRKLWTQMRSVSQLEHISFPIRRPFVDRRRLFSIDIAAAASDRDTQSGGANSNKQPLLPIEASHFHALDKGLREKAQGKYKAYEDVKDLQKRAPNFTVDDWHEFLCAISAMGIYGGRLFFAKNELSAMTEIIGHLAKCCERFAEPIDYFNFIRLLLRFEDSFNRFRNDLPAEVKENVSKWFLKNFHRLEPSAFFEIFLIRTQWLNKKRLLKMESDEDIMKLLEHGQHLAAENNGIVIALEMLQIINYYSNTMQRDKLDPLISEIFDIMASRKLPSSQSDLCTALKLVVGEQRKVIRSKNTTATSTRHIFRRFAENSPKAAWKWLRNSIEVVFDSDELDHLRQLAAFAAVDAFKCKAVDFSVEELSRYLSVAAQPFLNNPAYLLEGTTAKMPTVSRTTALRLLLEALYNGLANEPRLRDQLPLWVRFDDAYWDRFFDMLQKEASKRVDCRHLFGSIDLALRVRPEYPNRAPYQLIVAKPVNQRRKEIMRILTAAALT